VDSDVFPALSIHHPSIELLKMGDIVNKMEERKPNHLIERMYVFQNYRMLEFKKQLNIRPESDK
jgi:hypothetical protein